jgi:hypothetical protein
MSSIGGPCPKCEDVGPLSVVKDGELKDWSVACWLCGWVGEPGYYWKFHEGGYDKFKQGMDEHYRKCKEGK